MERSPLDKLAPESRNLIHELLLHDEDYIRIEKEDGRLHANTPPLALTKTCRQLRQEALPLFYSSNRFYFETGWFDDCNHPRSRYQQMIDAVNKYDVEYKLYRLTDWLNTIGEKNVEHVQHICMDFGAFGPHTTFKMFNEAWAAVDRTTPSCYLLSPCHLEDKLHDKWSSKYELRDRSLIELHYGLPPDNEKVPGGDWMRAGEAALPAYEAAACVVDEGRYLPHARVRLDHDPRAVCRRLQGLRTSTATALREYGLSEQDCIVW